MNRTKIISNLSRKIVNELDKYDDISTEIAQRKINELITKIETIKPEDNNIIRFLFGKPIAYIKLLFKVLFQDFIDGTQNFKNHRISMMHLKKICLRTTFNTILVSVIITELTILSFGSSMPMFSLILMLSVIGFAAQNYIKK